MADMTQFEQAVDQVILDSERLHKVVNGSASQTVVTEDGSTIPTVRKALLDNLFFKTPPMPWIAGTQSTVFNQLYAFNATSGVQWWYAPAATATAPVVLPSNPTNNVNWRLYNDAAALASLYAPINSPVLTGNPQAPTPLANSNSTTIATTAFVVQAVASALTNISGGTVSFTNLTVSGLSTLNNLTVNGTTTLNGPVNADNSTGRFENLVLTKQGSSLTFVYTDAANPVYLKTRLDPYSAQTHNLNTDIIVNGTVSADNTTMSLTGIGNNVFDYVYIRGNSSKAVTEPRLKVTGMTEVENLRITGAVTGLSLSVDGLDINPNSVTTIGDISVGGDLNVTGAANLGNTTVESLEVINTLKVDGATTMNTLTASSGTVTGPFTVAGLTTMNGGFNTGTANGRVGGDFSVAGTAEVLAGLNVTGDVAVTGGLTTTGNAEVRGGLTVSGDVVMNNGAGTTTVNNLVILGTVSGLTVDLTGQSITAQSVTSLTFMQTTDLSAATINAGFISLTAENVESSTASWTPSGTSNIYNVVVDSDLTIGKWPDPPGPFTAMIYLAQDTVGGHTVTLDANYLVLNPDETINTDPEKITILQLTYNGFRDEDDNHGVIDTVIVRRP